MQIFVCNKRPHFLNLGYMTVKILSSPEAAVRSQKQAESEDCNQVEIEHFEKVLPQLVSSSISFAIQETCVYYF